MLSDDARSKPWRLDCTREGDRIGTQNQIIMNIKGLRLYGHLEVQVEGVALKVVELFTSMREQSAREAAGSGNGPQVRSLSSAAALTSLCADISPSSSHFFEVLYIGKIKVSHRKVPETFIDEALERFRVHEKEKAQRRARIGSSASSTAILQQQTPHLHTPPPNSSPPPPDEESRAQGGTLSDRERKNGTAAPANPLKAEALLTHIASNGSIAGPGFRSLSSGSRISTETIHEAAVSGPSSSAAQRPGGVTKSLSESSSEGASKMAPGVEDSLPRSKLSADQPVNDGQSNVLVLGGGKTLLGAFRGDSEDSGCTSPLEMGSSENITDSKEQPHESSNMTSQLQSKLQEGAKKINPLGGAIDIKDGQSPDKSLRTRTISGDTYLTKQQSLQLEPMRLRAGSTGSSSNPQRVDSHSAEFKQSDAATHTEHNRTMLFQVGRTDLRLISPDRKQILMHKYLRDVVNCIQGSKNPEYFGFICKEPNVDCFVGYVFRCQSGSVADDVAGAITQAFSATNDIHRKEKQSKREVFQQPPPVVSCEHCPMVWYHKLCVEIEGLNDRRTQATIFRRLEMLPEDEQESVLIKFRGAETVSGSGNSPNKEGGSGLKEQNEFLMMLLRAHCESKQPRHVHDTAENRHEFLNHYLGGSTIFMKAKRSLTSSFDHLLKRRGSKDEFVQPTKELSLPINASLCKENIAPVTTPSGSSGSNQESFDSQKESPSNTPTREIAPSGPANTPAPVPDKKEAAPSSPCPGSPDPFRPRSSTVGSSGGETMKREVLSRHNHNTSPIAIPLSPQQQQGQAMQKSPMMNIFFKVGNQPKNIISTSPNQEKSPNARNKQQGSWRQAIFNRVVTPGKSMTLNGSGHGLSMSPTRRGSTPQSKKESSELRALWRKAIMQQILLIRMDKENARLTARQEEATVKRIKLDYEEISPCSKQVNEVWDLLVSKESRISTKCDSHMLLQALKQGVPRSKRGEVWQFLAEQHCLRTAPVDIKKFPNYNVSYRGLLKQLTSHQHGILVDLGRTFPSHPYFSSPLGPGQLELFNLLKAYSLLDPEVGYCQGLSFVAGVLLLHMSEESAFILLRHLLFRRGLRRQYLPDMAALQVQLYQLSRLLHDTYPDLYEHFDQNEVAPTLYAAPWILTIFASQFPLGFVTRVFDLLFLEGPDVIFSFAMALLGERRVELLACTNFEETMECLKTTVPNMDKAMLDRVMKQVFTTDVSRLLHEYEVEYHVLQEEMASSIAEPDTSRNLRQQNQELADQLKDAKATIECLELQNSSHKAAITCLESQVRNLENTLGTMARYVASMHEKLSPKSAKQAQNNVPVIPEMPADIWRYVATFSKSGIPNHTSNGVPPAIANQIKNKSVLPVSTSPLAASTPGILKTSLSTSDLSSVRARNGTTLPLNIVPIRDLSPLVLPSKPAKPLECETSSKEEEVSKLPSQPSPTSQQMHPLDCVAGDVNFTFGTSSLRSLKPTRASGNGNGSANKLLLNSCEDGLVMAVDERPISNSLATVPRVPVSESGLMATSGR
ncbi:TBC1 domain family member 1 isoform X2 [Ischnura elegans]|uniref:TBC1 domain family member 1 isoform X2 n=1 Tax=Ischnura elegans TaxID=197161 RepID=UPI001ED88E95|nr:TBC1 domain family member 1 isoform X2 [Ischnura elegans]